MLKQLQKGAYKALNTIGKHAPVIMTGAGVVALGATVYFTIKSKDKVDKHLDEFEERKENGEELKTTEVVSKIASDVAIPVVTGTLSITCFVGSYYILNKRVVGLSTALASSYAQYEFLRNKVKDEYGEEKLKDLEKPVRVLEKGTKKEPRKVEKVVLKSKQAGFWFCECDEYVSDDYGYNIAYIEEMNHILSERVIRTGMISLNYVLDMFGLPRTPEGAVLGWTDDSWSGLTWETVTVGQDDYTGEMKKEIWVGWNPMDLKFIYDTPDYYTAR